MGKWLVLDLNLNLADSPTAGRATLAPTRHPSNPFPRDWGLGASSHLAILSEDRRLPRLGPLALHGAPGAQGGGPKLETDRPKGRTLNRGDKAGAKEGAQRPVGPNAQPDLPSRPPR